MSTNIQFSLTAVEARDLLASDSNGKSDPYFKIPHNQYGVLDLPGKKHKSKVIKKNLNPVWNHTFESVEFNPTVTTKLQIEVFDYVISNPPYSVDGFMSNLMKNGICFRNENKIK